MAYTDKKAARRERMSKGVASKKKSKGNKYTAMLSKATC